MAHQAPPPEGWFDKGIRYAHQGMNLMGTMQGLYHMGRFAWQGIQAARPLLALL